MEETVGQKRTFLAYKQHGGRWVPWGLGKAGEVTEVKHFLCVVWHVSSLSSMHFNMIGCSTFFSCRLKKKTCACEQSYPKSGKSFPFSDGQEDLGTQVVAAVFSFLLLSSGLYVIMFHFRFFFHTLQAVPDRDLSWNSNRKIMHSEADTPHAELY